MVKDQHCFVFVCQSGELEAMAVLLAASVRAASDDRHELVAAVPIPKAVWGKPSQASLDALKVLNVRVVEIRNLVSNEHPISNKIDCLNLETGRPRICFLDSDIIMLRDFQPSEVVPGDVVAVPSRGQLVDRETWRRVYAQAGLDLPAPRVNVTSGITVDAPYVNTGVISVSTECAGPLSRAWTQASKRILATDGLEVRAKKHSNQLAFPIAAAMAGKDIEFASTDWNYPSWARSLSDSDNPIFYHYQLPGRLLRERSTINWVTKVVEGDRAVARAVRQHLPMAKVLSRGAQLKARVKSLLGWA